MQLKTIPQSCCFGNFVSKIKDFCRDSVCWASARSVVGWRCSSSRSARRYSQLAGAVAIFGGRINNTCVLFVCVCFFVSLFYFSFKRFDTFKQSGDALISCALIIFDALLDSGEQ